MNTTQSIIQTVDQATTLPSWLLHLPTFALCSIAERSKQHKNENTKHSRAARNVCRTSPTMSCYVLRLCWLTDTSSGMYAIFLSVSLNFMRCFCKLWTFLYATQSIVNQFLCLYVCSLNTLRKRLSSNHLLAAATRFPAHCPYQASCLCVLTLLSIWALSLIFQHFIYFVRLLILYVFVSPSLHLLIPIGSHSLLLVAVSVFRHNLILGFNIGLAIFLFVAGAQTTKRGFCSSASCS